MEWCRIRQISEARTSWEGFLPAAVRADPDRMSQPQTSDFFKGSPVETIGDVVAHLMTSHLAFHLGQISAWRRLQGRPPLI